MALNVLDFTRYAQTQTDQGIGTFGLVFSLGGFGFLGIAISGATTYLTPSGMPIWSLSDLFALWDSTFMIILANLVLLVSVIASNLTANMVSPANDFANLWPEKISYKMGGYVTCVLGIAVIPWKLFATPDSFIFIWLLGYSPVLGAIGSHLFIYFIIIFPNILFSHILFFHFHFRSQVV